MPPLIESSAKSLTCCSLKLDIWIGSNQLHRVCMQHWPYATHLMLEFEETNKCRHKLHNNQIVPDAPWKLVMNSYSFPYLWNGILNKWKFNNHRHSHVMSTIEILHMHICRKALGDPTPTSAPSIGNELAMFHLHNLSCTPTYFPLPLPRW
jgi:hypothetical protein